MLGICCLQDLIRRRVNSLTRSLTCPSIPLAHHQGRAYPVRSRSLPSDVLDNEIYKRGIEVLYTDTAMTAVGWNLPAAGLGLLFVERSLDR